MEISTSSVTQEEMYDKDNRLLFEDGRLYITETPIDCNGKQTDFPKKRDVTEEVLDVFLKIIRKREEDAYQYSIINQLKYRY